MYDYFLMPKHNYKLLIKSDLDSNGCQMKDLKTILSHRACGFPLSAAPMNCS